ncbi:hypothetical protein KW782_03365 [Candidatus Parcubacteria bacterium]|nr:hypothetical protein [Candidatus Parcubacteria bacterium]
MIKKSVGVFLLLMVIAAPVVTSAALLRTSDEVSFGRDQMIGDDVYAAGGSINSIATVTGDFVGAGGNLFISGNVTNDVIVAGGAINVVGTIGDDLRAAGGSLVISGSVADDAILAGGQVSVISGSTIGGDLIVSGGRVVVDGEVLGRIEAAGGEVIINGTVHGNVTVHADMVVIGEAAVINGKLIYSSAKEAKVHQNAKISGGVEYNTTGYKNRAAHKALWILIKLLTLAVSAYILQWIYGKVAVRLVTDSTKNSGRNILRGLAVLVVTPIIIGLLMITVVGIPVAVVLLLAYIVLLVLSCLMVPIFLGGIVWKYLKKNDRMTLNWQTALVGAFLTLLLKFIPIVGPIIIFIFMLLVLGTVTKMKVDYLRELR